MAWNRDRSLERITEFRQSGPTFDGNMTLAKRSQILVEARKSGLVDGASARRAFVVDGAHLYGYLLDYEAIVSDRFGDESEDTHRAALRFLSAFYRLWDAIVDGDDADRIDYHGARMHAVVTDPEGDPAGQIEQAVALAYKLSAASRRVAHAYGFSARVRFGIDQGRCVAMTTGRSHEKDVLFLGAAANYAAKLASAENIEGVFVSERAQRRSQRFEYGKVLSTSDSEYVLNAARRFRFEAVDRAVEQLIAESVVDAPFSFFRPALPLANLRFVDLSPSHTARMGMTSLFADIHNFTSFVDSAIDGGSNAVKRAALTIHVIREELNAVLQKDFGGKRVRFIGDCIQGVLGKGQRSDEPARCVRDGVLCASAMKSSFLLCQEVLGDIDELDLAVGLEWGPVPLTRTAVGGDDIGVRTAAGKAVVIAERVQRSIDAGGIVLGPTAQRLSDDAVRKSYTSTSSIPTYDSAVDLLEEIASPAVVIVRENPSARPYLSARSIPR